MSLLGLVHTLGNLLTNMSLGAVAVSFTHTIKVTLLRRLNIGSVYIVGKAFVHMLLLVSVRCKRHLCTTRTHRCALASCCAAHSSHCVLAGSVLLPCNVKSLLAKLAFLFVPPLASRLAHTGRAAFFSQPLLMQPLTATATDTSEQHSLHQPLPCHTGHGALLQRASVGAVPRGCALRCSAGHTAAHCRRRGAGIHVRGASASLPEVWGDKVQVIALD